MIAILPSSSYPMPPMQPFGAVIPIIKRRFYNGNTKHGKLMKFIVVR